MVAVCPRSYDSPVPMAPPILTNKGISDYLRVKEKFAYLIMATWRFFSWRTSLPSPGRSLRTLPDSLSGLS